MSGALDDLDADAAVLELLLADPVATLAGLDFGLFHGVQLKEPVEVLRDKWGIAHIYAKNRGDLFFAQGFEHSVVNMFIIPTGMMMGAKVTVADWWLWNQIPVTLGNLVGGFCFTGFAIYWTYKPASAPASEPSRATSVSKAISPAWGTPTTMRWREAASTALLGKKAQGCAIADPSTSAFSVVHRRGRSCL